jgi:hypothetical protein
MLQSKITRTAREKAARPEEGKQKKIIIIIIMKNKNETQNYWASRHHR